MRDRDQVRTKTARTPVFWLNVSVHVGLFRPVAVLQAPAHPSNRKPASGRALRVTAVPTGYVKSHSDVQVRPSVPVTMPPVAGNTCTLIVQVATANVAVTACAPAMT